MADENPGTPIGSGFLTPEQVTLMLDHLPVQITYADEKGIIKYYNEIPGQLFTRLPQIIGGTTVACHPTKSGPVVEKLLDAFKSGEQSHAEFWFELEKKFVHVQYFAVRDAEGNYRGIIETDQDVTHIRKMKRQKTTLDF